MFVRKKCSIASDGSITNQPVRVQTKNEYDLIVGVGGLKYLLFFRSATLGTITGLPEILANFLACHVFGFLVNFCLYFPFPFEGIESGNRLELG